MHRLVLLVAALTAASFVAEAHAQQGEYRTHAKVVRVTPIVKRGVEKIPVKLCTWEAAPDSLRYRRYQHQSERDRYFRRCHTTHETQVMEHVQGYRVTFRVGGETFHERLDERPRDAVGVRVKVTPLDR